MNILDTVGGTPLIRLNRISRIRGCGIYIKYEALNPGGSAAARVAAACVDEAFKQGKVLSRGCIVEACMPNMAIALAQVCTFQDIRLIVVMQDNINPTLLSLIRTMGAEIVLTDSSLGFRAAMEKAEALNKDIWSSCRLNLTSNDSAARAYARTLGPELERNSTDLGFKPDVFIAGIGTGSVMMGAGKYLKEHCGTRLYAVEPAESACLSGNQPGPHGIKGIGLGFIPPLLDVSILDGIVSVDEQDAVKSMRKLLSIEAVCSGISSGACLSAALQLSFDPEFAGKNIIIMGYDSGERAMYQSIF